MPETAIVEHIVFGDGRRGGLCNRVVIPIPVSWEIGCGPFKPTSRESAGRSPDGVSIGDCAPSVSLYIVAIDVRGLQTGAADGGDAGNLHLL